LSARRWCALWFCVFVPCAFGAGRDRVEGAINSSVSVPLRGSVPARATRSLDQGPLPDSTTIRGIQLQFGPSPEQQADLDQLLERQRDPSSPDYHRWFTPEEFGQRFGVSENDFARLRSWLEASGFTIEQTARAQNWISFAGTAAQIRTVFQTELHRFQGDAANGKDPEIHFANVTDPLIPASLSGIVTSIRGLDDFRPHPPQIRTSLSSQNETRLP